jgi:formylglycine-generating enzyme required for sulfatase activity
MVAIPEGTFMMGSNEDEQFRKEDEGPQRKVHLKKFFMSKTEVSWDEYWAFYNETKTNDRANFNLKGNIEEVDAISGPTPPYGNPDQGWGQGKQPAISMSWHAANVYCEWLSAKTGKKYRLPTEAEWEYACRGGTQMPYFFEGSPKSFSGLGFWKNIFSPDTAVINSFVAYKMNSERPQLPHTKKENPFGLVNMLGNVAEFCSDFYRKTAYGESDEIVYNPVGPNKGEERVVRGGSFRNDASDLRSAARSHTKTKLWLQSDPQYPKSIWWYSDCYHVGFRIVCEY